MAYVLGFFAADGYMTLNKRGANFWCIQITDGELLEWIKKIVGAEHKISERVRKGNEMTLYRLQIGSKEMCDDLRKLGFTEAKTKNMSVPNVPSEYFSHFVRGYFDGDGNVWVGHLHLKRRTAHLNLSCTFTSCSKEFLEMLQVKLCQIGTLGGYIYKTKRNCHRLTYSSGDSLKLYDFMYNHTDTDRRLYLHRKKIVFERYLYLKNAPVV